MKYEVMLSDSQPRPRSKIYPFYLGLAHALFGSWYPHLGFDVKAKPSLKKKIKHKKKTHYKSNKVPFL